MIYFRLSEEEAVAITVALACMLLDVISGLIKAYIKKELSSTALREGLLHKASLIIIIVLGYIIERGVLYVPSLGWSTPLLIPLCVIIVGMEVMSIWENLCEAYPELANSKILSLLKKGNDNE